MKKLINFNPNAKIQYLNQMFIEQWNKRLDTFLKDFTCKNIDKIEKDVKKDIIIALQIILQDLNFFINQSNTFVTSPILDTTKVESFYITSMCHIWKLYSDATLLFDILKHNSLFVGIDNTDNPFYYWKYANEKKKHYDVLNDFTTGKNKFFNINDIMKINDPRVPNFSKDILVKNNVEWRKDIIKRWNIKEESNEKIKGYIDKIYENAGYFTGVENDLSACIYNNIRFFVGYYTRIACFYDFFKTIEHKFTKIY